MSGVFEVIGIIAVVVVVVVGIIVVLVNRRYNAYQRGDASNPFN